MSRAPFPYPGSKARHADWVVDHLPQHQTYVEPFGGAAGVLFNKPPSTVDVYNDADADLVQFFEVLRERPDDLQAWLERVPFARAVYDEWVDAFYSGERPDDPIERAGRFFALRYMQWGGKYDGPAGFCTRPSRNGAVDFKHKTAALDEFADRLREVIIEQRDWRTLVDRYDTADTVFYCDPPYVDAESYYGDDAFDHRALCDTLSTIDGYALVSYDSVPPFYDEGWQVVTKDSTFQIDNVDGTGPKDATEVLLMNFDADGHQLMSDVGQQDLSNCWD